MLFHPDIDESIRIGTEAAAYCSTFMPKPVLLQFENVKFPFVLLGKKKYICYEYEKSSNEKPKFTTKGTVSKRRDNCLFIRELVKHISNIWAGKVKCPDGVPKLIHSINIAREKVVELKCGKVRFHEIILRKGLQKPVLEYTSRLTEGVYKLVKKNGLLKRVKSFYQKDGMSLFINALSVIGYKGMENEIENNSDLFNYIEKHTASKKRGNKNLLKLIRTNKDIKKLREMIKEWGSYNIVNCIEVVKNGTYVTPNKKLSPPPHVMVTLKIAKESPGNEPRSGDRVPYIIVTGEKKSKISERAESPETVLKKGMQPDYDYLAEIQVIRALGRLFSSILGTHTFDHIDYNGWTQKVVDKESKKVIEANRSQAIDILFSSIKTKTKKKIGTWGEITKYTVVIPKCLKCNCRLKIVGGKSKRRKLNYRGISTAKVKEYLCEDCRIHKDKLMSEFIKRRTELKNEDFSCRVQCKMCQMERYGQVHCANTECKYFHLVSELDVDIEDIDRKIYKLTQSFCNFSSSCDILDERISISIQKKKDLI